MATEATNIGGFQQSELSAELAVQWRRLTRAATYELEARRAVAATRGAQASA